MMNPNLRFLVSIRGQERGITENVKHSGLQKSELFLKKSHEGLLRRVQAVLKNNGGHFKAHQNIFIFLMINVHITV